MKRNGERDADDVRMDEIVKLENGKVHTELVISIGHPQQCLSQSVEHDDKVTYVSDDVFASVKSGFEGLINSGIRTSLTPKEIIKMGLSEVDNDKTYG